MAFVQLIEFTTSRLDEVMDAVDEWASATVGSRSALRGVLTADRDRPNTYVQLVDFASYEDAMANSALPQTDALARTLASLCDGPPAFRNLDVQRVDDFA